MFYNIYKINRHLKMSNGTGNIVNGGYNQFILSIHCINYGCHLSFKSIELVKAYE